VTVISRSQSRPHMADRFDGIVTVLLFAETVWRWRVLLRGLNLRLGRPTKTSQVSVTPLVRLAGFTSTPTFLWHQHFRSNLCPGSARHG
jgi:hypothetical protein